MIATANPTLSKPTLDLESEPELPNDPAFASDDPVVAPLLKAFQCEWLGLCDPYSVMLRSHVVKGVIEAERLQAATGHKPLWAGVMDVLADTGGWAERRTPWHRKLSEWTQFRVTHFDPPDPDPIGQFLGGWYMEHKDLERDDDLPVWPMPALWWQSDLARGLRLAEDAFWMATPPPDTQPEAQGAPKLAVSAPTGGRYPRRQTRCLRPSHRRMARPSARKRNCTMRAVGRRWERA